MRNNATVAEKILWARLRKSQLGVKFRRQQSIGPYIVDFYCPQIRLVIELDGKQHFNNKDYDDYRTEYLNALNIKVIRYWNDEIQTSINSVINEIKNAIDNITPPQPSPNIGEGERRVSSPILEGDQEGILDDTNLNL